MLVVDAAKRVILAVIMSEVKIVRMLYVVYGGVMVFQMAIVIVLAIQKMNVVNVVVITVPAKIVQMYPMVIQY